MAAPEKPALSDEAFLDKIHGCLLGLAIGDAIAMPGLCTHELTVAVHGGEITGFVDASPDESVDPVHAKLPAGMGTDDSYAATTIVRHLSRRRRLTVSVVVDAYVDWIGHTDRLCADLGRSRGFAGPNTRKAMDRILDGGDPRETGSTGTTSGAAMRIAPFGFLFPGDFSRTVDAVEISCIPTHNTGVAIAGAGAVACAVSAIATGVTDLDEVIDAAVAGAELGISRGRPYTAPSVARRIVMAQEIARSGRGLAEIRRDLYDLVGNGMESHEVVPSALALLRLAEGDLKQATLLAANAGGDCDTMGAIAGAIAGARCGRSGIADEDSELIESVNNFDLATVSRQFLDAVNETWGRSSSPMPIGS